MYCRNVYLRTGLVMPSDGWVLDLGANCGLFSVWAAATGAQVVAVEAQQGFSSLISRLATYNGVSERVHVVNAFASGTKVSGKTVGSLADDAHWVGASHSTGDRPTDISVADIISSYHIDRVGLIKMDIEGGEFAVLAQDENLSWLEIVEQITLEVHSNFGDVPSLVRLLSSHGFLISSHDNDGIQVRPESPTVNYVYCARAELKSRA
jgi:FkbM family methyltransferase